MVSAIAEVGVADDGHHVELELAGAGGAVFDLDGHVADVGADGGVVVEGVHVGGLSDRGFWSRCRGVRGLGGG